MPESAIIVSNQLGLHARAAAQLVRLANEFSSDIIISRKDNDATADAKSILSVLMLAAAKGVEVTIKSDGADADAALKAVVKMFADGFGEK